MESKIGRYLILEQLSPGSVFLAEDSAGTKKLLKQYELTSNFVLSDFVIKILVALKHKNILPPSDIFTEGNFKYAVYDYNNADNLQNYLKKRGKLTQEESLRISRQIIDAYEFIQNKGLIHGSIKPTNILIDENDGLTIKLTDFLLRLNKGKDLSKDKFTAPEIASKEKSPNILSDVYSIGAIIKLLSESTETFTDTSTRLIEDCLQTDSNKRIQFNALTLHPYFTSIHPIYKLFQGKLLSNIRLLLHLYLYQRRRYNFKIRGFLLLRMYNEINVQTRI